MGVFWVFDHYQEPFVFFGIEVGVEFDGNDGAGRRYSRRRGIDRVDKAGMEAEEFILRGEYDPLAGGKLLWVGVV